MSNVAFPKTEAEWCAYWHGLDFKFRTEKNSPLHHDNRCTNHTKGVK